MSVDVTVRPATVEDIPFLRAMMWEALLASPTFLVDQDIELLELVEEREWLRWRDEPTPAFVAVDAAGRSLGALRMRPHRSDAGQGWQIGIGVEADARNQGVGRRLIERALEQARATRAAYLYLVVDPTNDPAIALYRRTGFVEIGAKDSLIEMRLSA